MRFLATVTVFCLILYFFHAPVDKLSESKRESNGTKYAKWNENKARNPYVRKRIRRADTPVCVHAYMSNRHTENGSHYVK